MRKEGSRLVLEPVPPRSLLAVLRELPTLDEEFPPVVDAPATPVDL
jgi:antitoxin VapB